MKKLFLIITFFGLISACKTDDNNQLDLSNTTILISPSIRTKIQQTAQEILTEEIEKRTELQLRTDKQWNNKTTIALALISDTELFGIELPSSTSEIKKEGYRIFHESKNGKNTLWIIGADERGVLFGIGKLLRTAEMHANKITIAKNIDTTTSPEYALRGHQFGYRNTANSWDSWTVAQFDQHFREQVLFGANSFENIPL
ncbi:MAG: hypothetical protein KAH07_00340, partial [Flavobacteriaceae bacterium]|nr:hypothetical protein [Flavobacteriaceae bacterium]